MRVLIVVLNWNGADDTMACLDALERQTYGEFDVLVIDNGSDQIDVARLRARASRGAFSLHEEPRNLGFAGGVNVGIRRARAAGYDAVALLNNDAVVESDWLEVLVRSAERTGASITTGLMLRRSSDPRLDGTIDTAGDALSIWGMPFPTARGYPRDAAPPGGPVFSASGGASLYRVDVFDRIGLFDERFFAYFEDVDLGFRARLARLDIVYEPAAVAHHRIGASSSRVPGFTVLQTFKNLPLLVIKNVPRGLRRRMLPRFAALYALMFMKAVLTGNGRPAARGAFQALRLLRTHALPERRRIQSDRTAEMTLIESLLWHDLPPQQHGMRRLVAPLRKAGDLLRSPRSRLGPTPRG